MATALTARNGECIAVSTRKFAANADALSSRRGNAPRSWAQRTERHDDDARAAGSGLDSYLYAYDTSEQPITSDEVSGGALDSRVSFQVQAGLTYYVRAAASEFSTGNYQLTLLLDLKLTPTDVLPDEVKRQATVVTDSYNDEGFAKAMERFVLDAAG